MITRFDALEQGYLLFPPQPLPLTNYLKTLTVGYHRRQTL